MLKFIIYLLYLLLKHYEIFYCFSNVRLTDKKGNSTVDLNLQPVMYIGFVHVHILQFL